MGKERQRKLLSCVPCRQLKVSCDRRQPCTRCAWRQKPDGCFYRTYSRDKVGPESEGIRWVRAQSISTSGTGLPDQHHPAHASTDLDSQLVTTQTHLPKPEEPQRCPETRIEGNFVYSKKRSRPVWSSTKQCRTHWKPLLQRVPLPKFPYPRLLVYTPRVLIDSSTVSGTDPNRDRYHNVRLSSLRQILRD